jgi:hypothetical protein
MNYLIVVFLLLLLNPFTALAGPASDNYELQEYQFGAGGTGPGFSSANFSLFGLAGQIESSQPGSTNFKSGNGLVYLLESGVPPAPSLSNNGGLYYNKLLITINYTTVYASIPSDILFAVAVSTDFGNPTLTKYVQADQTLGDNPVWQSYTTWGGASGFILSGLTPSTTYFAKVAARQGNFTQTGFGPANTPGIATAANSISFLVRTVSQSTPPFNLDLGSLIPGSVITAADQGQITITTNAASGALIYIYGDNSGLQSSSQGNYTIDSVSDLGEDLSLLTQGYGIRGTSVSQSSGHMVISQPYNGSGDNVGPVDTSQRVLFTTDDAPVDSGIGRFEIRAKASLVAPPASDYTDTLTIIAAGAF